MAREKEGSKGNSSKSRAMVLGSSREFQVGEDAFDPRSSRKKQLG